VLAVAAWMLAVAAWVLAVAAWVLAVAAWILAVAAWVLAVAAWILAAAAWVLAVAGVSLIKAGDDTPVTAADFAIQGAPSRPQHTHRVAARGRGVAAWVGCRGCSPRGRGVAACSTYGCRHDLGAAAHGVPQGPLHG
jgi:hypothetical protein